MKKILQALNDYHWYIIAAALIAVIMIYLYGCESTTTSLITPEKKINRGELQVELEYLTGIARTRAADLDQQDEIKQALLDSLVVVSQGGQLNAMGLVNLVATITAIGWGLERNQRYKTSLQNKQAA